MSSKRKATEEENPNKSISKKKIVEKNKKIAMSKSDKRYPESKDRDEIDESSKVADEVDELFGRITKVNQQKKERNEADCLIQNKERKQKEELAVKIKRAELESNQAQMIISPDPPVHRWDKESGLPVYKYTALKVGDGGGTPLCPFDCNCCF
jgi:hypothetical protein